MQYVGARAEVDRAGENAEVLDCVRTGPADDGGSVDAHCGGDDAAVDQGGARSAHKPDAGRETGAATHRHSGLHHG